jgi:hypothetical protein
VGQCNHLCSCKDVAAQGLACYLKNPAQASACAILFVGKSNDPSLTTIGLKLIGCVNSSCKEACATSSFEKDSGTPTDQDGGP